MKSRVVLMALVVVLSSLVGTNAFAQFRMDIDINVPFSATLVSDIMAINGGTNAASTSIPFTFLVPDVKALGQAELGIVRLGGGVRLFSIILETILFPEVFAEVKLGPVAANLSLGGYAYGLVGIYSNLHFWNVMTIDASLGFDVTNWFRAQVGFFGLTPFDDMNNFVGVVYAGGKFILTPGAKKN